MVTTTRLLGRDDFLEAKRLERRVDRRAATALETFPRKLLPLERLDRLLVGHAFALGMEGYLELSGESR